MLQTSKQFLLDSLIYIKLPEDLVKSVFSDIDCSVVDSNIRLPIQVEDPLSIQNGFDISTLTVEMIIAGMFTVFAYNRKHRNIDYYRRLCLLLRPKIREEVLTNAITGIDNKGYEAAKILIEAIIGLDDECLEAHLVFAYLYEVMAKDKPEEREIYRAKAQEIYESLISREKPYPPAFFSAAIFFLKDGKFEKTKSLLETYIALKIDDTDEEEIKKVERAQFILNYVGPRLVEDKDFQNACKLIKEGKPEDSLPLIRCFIERNPKGWNGWFVLGWALRLLERWTEGEEALRKTLELYEKNEHREFEQQYVHTKNEYSGISSELALCLVENKKMNEARIVLEKALTQDCENVTLISNLGVIALLQDDVKKAKSYFKTALYIDPNDKLSKVMLKKI